MDKKTSTALKTVWYLFVQALQVYAALATIFGVSVVVTMVAWLRSSPNTPVLLSFTAGFLLAFIALHLALVAAYRSRPISTGYQWRRVEMIYRIHDDDPLHHSYTRISTVRAVRPGVNHIEYKYRWTGQGKEDEMTVQVAGQQGRQLLVGPPIRFDSWKYYYIHLGRQLAVGDEAKVETTQQLYDYEGQFEPYLAKSVTEPIGFLSLCVRLREGCVPSRVDLAVERLDSGAVLTRSEGVYDSAACLMRWDIPSPVVGCKYSVRWSW